MTLPHKRIFFQYINSNGFCNQSKHWTEKRWHPWAEKDRFSIADPKVISRLVSFENLAWAPGGHSPTYDIILTSKRLKEVAPNEPIVLIWMQRRRSFVRINSTILTIEAVNN